MAYVCVIIACIGGLLFGYETGVAASGLRGARDILGSGNDALVLLTSGTLLGALLGALTAGRLADITGRRDVIMATAALFTLGAFSSAVAPSLYVLVLARVVVGVAVGAVSVVVPVYLAEVAPPARRGLYVTGFQLAITIGLLLAFLADEALGTKAIGWRFVLGGGAVFGLILAAGSLLLIESPVWLGLQGDETEAAAAARQLGLVPEALPLALSGQPDKVGGLLAPQGRRYLLLCAGLFLFQQFVGINSVLYFAHVSLSGVDFSFGAGLGMGDALPFVIVNVLATLVAMALIDRVGRRPLLLVSFAIAACGLLVIAVGLGLGPLAAPSQSLIAGGSLLFVAGFAVGVGPVPWVTVAEAAPMTIRGLAAGVAAASHWLFDSLASPSGLLLSGEWARSATFVIYACVAVAGIAIFRRALPEFRARSLADIHVRAAAAATAALEKGSMFMHYSVTALVTTGGILIGFNFSITAATLVLLTLDWSLSELGQGTVASVMVLALAVGSFIAGSMADRFGRRYVLMSTAALFVAGAFGSALAPNLAVLLVARAAIGFAIGIASPTTAVYVTEIAPAAIRGRLLSFEAVTYGVGAILAYCVGLAFEAEPDGWRYMFAFIAIPSTIYGLLLVALPESPRWLVATGRPSAARRALRRFQEPDLEAALSRLGPADDEPSRGGGPMGGSMGALMGPGYRPALMVALAIMLLIVFCGWDMVLFYAPTILKQVGFADTTVSFIATLGLSSIFLGMTIVSLQIVDRAGRKPLIVSGLIVMAACLGAMAAIAWSSTVLSGTAAWSLLILLAVFVGTFALTLGQVGEIVVAEIFPQAIRGAGTSVAHGARSLFAFVFTLTFPFYLSTLGLSLTFLSYAVLNILGALYLWRFMPETKGRSLEEIDGYWLAAARNV